MPPERFLYARASEHADDEDSRVDGAGDDRAGGRHHGVGLQGEIAFE